MATWCERLAICQLLDLVRLDNREHTLRFGEAQRSDAVSTGVRERLFAGAPCELDCNSVQDVAHAFSYETGGWAPKSASVETRSNYKRKRAWAI